jgi:hypothetical protein
MLLEKALDLFQNFLGHETSCLRLNGREYTSPPEVHPTHQGFTISTPCATSFTDAFFDPDAQNIDTKPQGSSNCV